MYKKILLTLFAWVFISQQAMSEEITLSIPLNTTVIQSSEESFAIKGYDPMDWGGKFKIKENRNIESYLTVDGISEGGQKETQFDLTIELKKFDESIQGSSPLEWDDEEDEFDLTEEVRHLFDLPIQAEFNGNMTLKNTESEEYLLYDVGIELYFRYIFIPVEKSLEVGRTLTQEFFMGVDDFDFPAELEIEDELFWDNDDDDYGLDDQEPTLLIEYTITEITDSEVFADISGRIVTASPTPSMKPKFTLQGKGVWQRTNPLVNEISFDFDYSEKRTYSHMSLKGFRKTKSRLL